MHTLTSSFVPGYHGCDKEIADRILSGRALRPSQNAYDWLGPGVYFWEVNPRRGLAYARELQKLRRSPKITTPAVIGAVVELGLCLDLTTSAGVQQVKAAYESLREITETSGGALPSNDENTLLRNLDCAVIRLLHAVRREAGEPAIDTVKGVFVEGAPIYPTSGFRENTHTQICVCNPDCVKGVFRMPQRFLT